MRKRLLSLLLALVLSAGLLPLQPAEAATVQTAASAVSGAMYTDNAQLAQKLDAIFAGSAGIYSDAACKKPVNAALGTTAVAPGKTLYVGPAGKYALNSGESCWIYANGVYYTLFGEALGNGTPGENSQRLGLSGTSHMRLTYENLDAWGVRRGVGAQVRVGTHSIILLAYDETGLTYLDGNGDGKGLIALRRESWTEVKANSSIGGQKKVSYIIQPKQSYLDAIYPDASAAYINNCTAYPAYCRLRMTAAAAVKALPGGEGTKTLETLAKGTAVTALELYRDPAGGYWYKLCTAAGNTGYVSAGDTEMTELLWDVALSGVSAPGKLTQGQSFSIGGTVKTACTELTQVGVWVEQEGRLLTGTQGLEMSGKTCVLKSSALNQQVKFGSLAAGSYTYCIRAVAKSYYVKNGTELVCHTEAKLLYSEGFTVYAAACVHSYRVKLTVPTESTPGCAVFTCKSCGHSCQERYVTIREPEADGGVFGRGGYMLTAGILAAARQIL